MLHKNYPILFFSRFICICFAAKANYSISQYTFEDFSHSINQKEKAGIALNLHDVYVRGDIDSIKILALGLLSEDSKQDLFSQATGSRLIGSFLMRKGECLAAVKHLKYAADFFESIEDYTHTSEIYNEMGHALQLLGQFDESIIVYRKSMKLGRLSDDVTARFNGMLGMGRSYVMKGDTMKGIELIQFYKSRALKLNKFEAVADAYGYLGMIAEKQNLDNLSTEYFDKSVKYGLMSPSKVYKSHAITNLGIRNFNLGHFKEARKNFFDALALREELHNSKTIVESYFNLAIYFDSLDSNDQALKYFLYTIEFSEMNGFVNEELDAITELLRSDLNFEARAKIEQRKRVLESKRKSNEGLDEYLMKLLNENSDKFEKNNANDRGELVYLSAILAIAISIGLVFFRTKIN